MTWRTDPHVIKIGTTSNPAERLRSHAHAVGRPVDFLVAHPGGRQEERTQHRRFHHLRVGIEPELFAAAPELLEHIERVRVAWPNWRDLVATVAGNVAGRVTR